MEITNSQQILTYLNDFSYRDSKYIQELIQEIEKLRAELSQKTVSMVKLSHYRIITSNTLKRKENLIGWDKANQRVFQSIANIQKINKEEVSMLNSLLTQVESAEFRDDEIYSGPLQYLHRSELDSAWTAFEKEVIDTPHSILRSCELYIWLVTLHPFSNGNGRTARIVADWSLLEQSYLPLCFDSSVSSHVAATIGSDERRKEQSITKTLNSIIRAYKISLS